MVKYQWNIFWVSLDPIKGSEQSGTRPVLVVSNEDINATLPTIAILPITSLKPGRKIYSIETFISKEESGLPKDSIVMAHQIRCISKERLKEKCGSITSLEMRQRIKQALEIYLDLGSNLVGTN
ncbi:MAG: type II toxin-antitoxin system PemK/MazF family toxin [Clostridiales bacterium]|nr:type II toxin-antitoxin system PemK/MazF family toxin [Clostridiales bacterium]